MYRSLEFYPKPNNVQYEQLALTVYATKVLKKFWRYLEEHGFNDTYAGAILSCSANIISRNRNMIDVPTLSRYLKMKEILHIRNCPQDVNYAYAYICYPPAEIIRRIQRLCKRGRMEIGFKAIAEDLGMRAETVEHAVRYKYDRSPNSYAQVMFWIAREEKARGYEDALEFYK